MIKLRSYIPLISDKAVDFTKSCSNSCLQTIIFVKQNSNRNRYDKYQQQCIFRNTLCFFCQITIF